MAFTGIRPGLASIVYVQFEFPTDTHIIEYEDLIYGFHPDFFENSDVEIDPEFLDYVARPIPIVLELSEPDVDR